MWMREFSIYVDKEDALKVEQEERNLFVKEVLFNLGVPLDDIWPDDQLSIEAKIKLRRVLSSLDLEIVDDGDRGVKVFHENDLLAQWYKPKYILREELNHKTRTKHLYYEMQIKTESVFEGESNE
jgi:hypothetical protein